MCGVIVVDAENKDANKTRLKANMIRDRPGAIGFTRGFSQEHKYYGG